MTHYLRLSAMLILLSVFTSCQDDDVTPALEVPTSYTFTRAGQSTVSFTGQTERIAMAGELVSALRDFDQTEADLNNKFRNTSGTSPFSDPALNASTKSVRSKVAASQDLFFANATASAAIKADFDGWITAQVSEVFPNRNELATAGQAGQLADGTSVRYVNDWGLEYNQAFAKSLIGALMYDQIANNYLSPTVLDEAANRANQEAGITESGQSYTTMEHKWDEAFGYLFGASADPANPLTDLGSADRFLNEYVGKVDEDPDFAGIAATIEQAYRTGRAAIVANDYQVRDQQAAIIRENLGKAIAIRAVYYLRQGENALRAQPAAYGKAFHAFSEAYGFVYSMRFITSDNAVAPTEFSDAQLAILRNAAGNGFWDIDPDAVNAVAADVATRFGFNVDAAAE